MRVLRISYRFWRGNGSDASSSIDGFHAEFNCFLTFAAFEAICRTRGPWMIHFAKKRRENLEKAARDELARRLRECCYILADAAAKSESIRSADAVVNGAFPLPWCFHSRSVTLFYVNQPPTEVGQPVDLDNNKNGWCIFMKCRFTKMYYE